MSKTFIVCELFFASQKISLEKRRTKRNFIKKKKARRRRTRNFFWKSFPKSFFSMFFFTERIIFFSLNLHAKKGRWKIFYDSQTQTWKKNKLLSVSSLWIMMKKYTEERWKRSGIYGIFIMNSNLKQLHYILSSQVKSVHYRINLLSRFIT